MAIITLNNDGDHSIRISGSLPELSGLIILSMATDPRIENLFISVVQSVLEKRAEFEKIKKDTRANVQVIMDTVTNLN